MKERKELIYSRALVLKKGKIHKKTIIFICFMLFIGIMIAFIYKYKTSKNITNSGDILNVLDNVIFMGLDEKREIGKDLMEIDYVDNLTSSISYPEIGIEEIDKKIKNIITVLKDDFLLMHKGNTNDIQNYFQYIEYETYLAPENKMSLIFIEAQVVNDANVISEKVFTYIFDLESGEILKQEELFKTGYAKKITEELINYFETNELYVGQMFQGYQTTLNELEKSGYKIALTSENLIIYFDKYEIMPGSYGIVKINIPYDKIKDYILYINFTEDQVTKVLSGDLNTSNDELSGESVNNENIRYANANVNIRTEATINSVKLGILKEGESITIIENLGEWTKVLYNDKEAYVKSDYLSRKKLAHEVVELTIKDRGIDPSKPMVAITYDDGPNPIATPKILNTLEKYNAVATFFDLGQLVNTYPEIVKREESLNCEVGNHTYSHANLNILSEEELEEEIQKSELAFEKALGHKTTLFRPAYGNANSTVKEIVNYPLITWNVDSLDWKSRNKDKILEEIRKIKNYDGKIILLHSIYESTAEATEILVPELIEKGYQLVTVSELAYYKGKTLETGKVYTNF